MRHHSLTGCSVRGGPLVLELTHKDREMRVGNEKYAGRLPCVVRTETDCKSKLAALKPVLQQHSFVEI